MIKRYDPDLKCGSPEEYRCGAEMVEDPEGDYVLLDDGIAEGRRRERAEIVAHVDEVYRVLLGRLWDQPREAILRGDHEGAADNSS